MKHPEHKMSLEATMPLSDTTLSWLGHQLELRGIDSVIYTRYIISLLQQDVADIDSADREGFWDRKSDIKKIKEKKDLKKKPVSEEERRKNAAVECLLSVSDEDNDIESLVEELCNRLKEHKSTRDYFTPLSIHTKEQQSFQTSECQDPAERYYAAFPALPGEGTPPQVSPSSDDNIWRRNSRKSSSLAGETSGSKQSSPQNNSPQTREENTAKEVMLEKRGAGDSKSSSSSPATTDKRKKSKGDASQKITPTGRKKAAGPKGKKEPEGHSKAVRFLSWPPTSKKDRKKVEKTEDHEETEEERYCSMVEQMLKEMLLSGKKHVNPHLPVLAYFPEEGFTDQCFTEWFREDSQSPEFTENDDWYTQPLEHIFYTPVSKTKRLYKRHSYPPTLLNIDSDEEWSSLVTEQLLCLKRASQEYILLGDVFDPENSNTDEGNGKEKTNDSQNVENIQEQEVNKDEQTVQENMEGPERENANEDGNDKVDHLKKDIPQPIESDPAACMPEKSLEEEHSPKSEVLPLWYDTQSTPSDPFNFDQEDFFTFKVDETSMNSNQSALSLTLPYPFPGMDPECLVPVSEASSPVSSVEKGYFSDVTETSYVYDMSRHTSPFPDMLLLMNYGEEEDTTDITSTASSLKGSRLESLFESTRNEEQETCQPSEVLKVNLPVQCQAQPEFDFCADDLFPYQPEEESYIPSGTKNMFQNGAFINGNPQEPIYETNLEAEADKSASATSSSDSQLRSTDSSSEERDESACFPSDLFNSFSSVGESSGGSVLTESALVDHNFVLDLLDTQEVSLQSDCPTSLFFHLSPGSGSGSCWQSKVLLHDYGENLSFGKSCESSLDWDSVLSQTKRQVWESVMSGSPVVELSLGSPALQGGLWQLWNVNGKRKMPDLWQRTSEDATWNSILNLSVYSPRSMNDQTAWPNEDVLFSEIINEEDAVLGLQFLEEIDGFGCKGPRYERSVSESDLNNMSNSVMLDTSKPNLDISYELIPSENSAFQGVVPKKLHHVRSAPNLRYKSLISMLPDSEFPPIGLSSTESPVEHLYFSAKTHFRPIQTPVATPDEEVESQIHDLFGGMSGNNGTPYQHFVNPGEEASKFRPKFKIQKDLDKYIQTGGSLDETDDKFKQYNPEQDLDTQTEFIEEVVGCILEDASEVIMKEQKWNDDNMNPEKTACTCSDVPTIHEEQFVIDLCESFAGLAHVEDEKRKDDHVIDIEKVKTLEESWDGEKIKEMHLGDSAKSYHDIWSSGYEIDLHPFSVENECLFLPCTVDEKICESQVTKDESEAREDEEKKYDNSDELYFYYLDNYPEVDSFILSSCADECSGQQNYEVSGLIPIPHQAVYSSDLEKQWLERRALSGKNSKKKSQKLKSRKDSSKRKPCSFFLEGNCKRSDCKFSHDLSSITCRFWEEGLCFKGTLCPFFHGYPSDSETVCHGGKNGDRFEYKKDEFPELDTFGKMKHKESHSQKISFKRQAHKEFLKKTMSTRKKNRQSKQPTRTIASSSC